MDIDHLLERLLHDGVQARPLGFEQGSGLDQFLDSRRIFALDLGVGQGLVDFRGALASLSFRAATRASMPFSPGSLTPVSVSALLTPSMASLSSVRLLRALLSSTGSMGLFLSGMTLLGFQSPGQKGQTLARRLPGPFSILGLFLKLGYLVPHQSSS